MYVRHTLTRLIKLLNFANSSIFFLLYFFFPFLKLQIPTFQAQEVIIILYNLAYHISLYENRFGLDPMYKCIGHDIILVSVPYWVQCIDALD